LTVLRTLDQHLDAFVSGNHLPTPTTTQVSVPPKEQRVTPIVSPQPPPLQRVTAVPATLLANNLTTSCILCAKPCTHQRKTRGNTPGALLLINRAHHVPPPPLFIEVIEPTPPPEALPATTTMPRQSTCIISAPLPQFNNVRFVSQEAINNLIVKKVNTHQNALPPLQLCPKYTTRHNLEHYSLAMAHPITGEHITSYHKLMLDPATSEVWMTAFGKDYGGMCQGNNKTKTKGTDVIFVMDPKDVPSIPKNQPPTYAKVIVAYRPQKEDPIKSESQLVAT
jgi:hypothetical protein